MDNRIFDPITSIINSELILVDSQWPNFHDAELHQLNIWRGDVRPQDNVWIGPQIEMTLELCALQNPFMTTFSFRDCEAIRLEDFNHQNAIYDLTFRLIDRGLRPDGEPLPPFIEVRFEQAFGAELSFRCMAIEVLSREPVIAD